MVTNKTQNLKNKRVLITAGPTWVPIDEARVISNVASGETGVILSEAFRRLGAKVTLLLGPAAACCLDKKIRLLRFKFFEELKNIITRELRSHKYDVVIHSAAVSDYKPSVVYAQKVKSGRKAWKLNLVPTTKIIGLIKKVDDSVFLVGFKFEPGASKSLLIKRTKELIKRGRLDLAVGNSINGSRYEAYIVSNHSIYGPLRDKARLVKKLVSVVGENFPRGVQWKK